MRIWLRHLWCRLNGGHWMVDATIPGRFRPRQCAACGYVRRGFPIYQRQFIVAKGRQRRIA